jgi:hypothetical protein
MRYRAGKPAQGIIMDNWISVEDSLPEEGNYIVSWVDGGKPQVGTARKWASGPFLWTRGGVTHWMPFPEPPKEGE